MKKIMIGVLVIIPLIVVLTIGLVTNFISVRAYISVESVILENNSVELEITHSPDDYYSVDDLVGIMGVSVSPAHATNPAVEMTLSGITPLDSEIKDADGDGRDDVTEEYYVEFLKSDKASHTDIIGTGEGDGGYLKVSAYCAFDITVTAEGSVSARCSVRVTGALSAIKISGASTVEVGDSILLAPVFTPIDAVVRSAVWSSNDEAAVVDPNGVVTGISEGIAKISVSVTREDGEEVSAAVTVEVVRGATVFGSEVYTHLRTVSLAALGLSDQSPVTPISNCTVSDGNIVIDASATEASFRVSDDPVTMYVCGEDELVVKGSEYFAAEGYVLERDGMPLWLTVDWKSDLKSNPAPAVASWSSNAEAVATVSADGYVRGIANGSVTITAVTENGGSVSLDITVARKVAVLQLEDTEASMQLGLARQTVVATGKYDGQNIVDNTYTVDIRYPVADEGESAEEFNSAFLFSLAVEGMDDASAYIRFDGNAIIFDYDKIKEDGVFSERTKVTVTVSARYPKYDDPALSKYSTASFSFYVIDGVQVSDYSQLKSALTEDGIDAVLANSVAVEGNATIYSKASLYGNGYAVYTTQLAQLGSSNDKSVAIITVKESNTVVSNVTLRANPVPEDGVIKAETYQQGYCLRFDQAMWENQLVEYSIFENARSTMSITGGKITVVGTIIRNTSGGGIHVRCPANYFTDLTMRNCVLTNCLSPSNFQYQAGYNGTDAGGNPSVPEGAPTKTTLTIEGFLDAYCWFDISQGSFIPDETLEDALSSVGNSSAVDFVQGLLRNIVLSSDYLAPFRYNYNNGTYVHVAFMSSGLTVRSYLPEGDNFTTDDDRFNIISTSDFEDSLLGALEDLGILKYPLYLWSYDNTVTDITPSSVCVVNSRLIDRIHSEV